MTHAFIALAHGRIVEAVHDNLLSPFLFPALFLTFVLSLYDTLTGKEHLRPLWVRAQRFVVPLVLVLALLAWSWNIYKASVGHWPNDTDGPSPETAVNRSSRAAFGELGIKDS
jgi:hypothetical protein